MLCFVVCCFLRHSHCVTLFYLLGRQSKRTQINCPKEELMGGPQIGGGWDVCIAEPYNLVPPCLVYSIGYTFVILVNKIHVQTNTESVQCLI